MKANNFKLSARSKRRLRGVDDDLQLYVCEGLNHSKIDYGVSEGVRTLKRQKKLLAEGFTTVLKSKHLEGLAVDLIPYVKGTVSWRLENFYPIVTALRKASKVLEKQLGKKIKIRWGGAWHINNILTYKGTPKQACNAYVKLRKSQGREPFIDAPHFEIMV